jgi:DNA repair protein RecN (Recombination protein N)
MLTSLKIQNVVTIENLVIDFQGGLCVLTGETGAGKSILLDSLGLATGARAESGLVRKGSEQASVVAVLECAPKHPVYKIMTEAAIEIETGEPIILRRFLSADGKSKAFINDQAVSVSLLRDVGQSLIEIHGQFETQGLMDPQTHRQILDDFGGLGDMVSAAWRDWRDAEAHLDDLRQKTENARREESYLREALEDLEKLNPQAGEEKNLSGLRERLMYRAQALEALNAAYHVLSAEDDPVRKAASILGRASAKIGSAIDPVLAALDRISIEMNEAIANIESISGDLQESEHSLESIDDRLHQLRTQARKHGCAVDDLPRMRDEIAEKLKTIYNAEGLLDDARAAAEKHKKVYDDQAHKAREIRRKAAAKLDKLVMAELAPLKLERAKFETKLEELSESEWGPFGMDRIMFTVATNPGSEPGPLHKIASGGEMARFMLAIKVVMAAGGPQKSMVFDEVDSGIGGSTADAVGERLARLAQGRQVLVVTHSPQVAARGAHHWIVRKGGEASVATAVVALQSRAARSEEIARMLAGASITPEARAAADRLLENAA